MIYIFLRSKYQDILDRFWETFIPTVKGNEVTVYVFHPGLSIFKTNDIKIISIVSDKLGNEAYAPHLGKIMSTTEDIWRNNHDYFGIFNDDLTFSSGWLETVLDELNYSDCVTPGYINTRDMKKFERAVEETKNEAGSIPLMMGACQLFPLKTFLKIGMLDTQFDWAFDDLDLMWRIHLNGLKSVTLKRITIAHAHGLSRGKEMSRWNKAYLNDKEKFCNKFGTMSLKSIRVMYKGHDYFLNYGK